MTSPIFPHWRKNEIARPVSFAGCWFVITLSVIAILVMMISPASADTNMTNTTNITPPLEPVVLSFMGGHMFGENPVEIFYNRTSGNISGRIAFIGNTSSKGVNLSPEYGYDLRVEPSGISDAANSPDAGLVGLMQWAEKNPLGTLFLSLMIAAILISLNRRK